MLSGYRSFDPEFWRPVTSCHHVLFSYHSQVCLKILQTKKKKKQCKWIQIEKILHCNQFLMIAGLLIRKLENLGTGNIWDGKDDNKSKIFQNHLAYKSFINSNRYWTLSPRDTGLQSLERLPFIDLKKLDFRVSHISVSTQDW